MTGFSSSNPYPEGVISFLDTDLYKLTMQCAVLRHFPDVQVSYTLTNRTSEKKLSRAAFDWLYAQIMKLGNISLSHDELCFLQSSVAFLSKPYLDFLQGLHLNPREQVSCSFIPDESCGDSNNNANDLGRLVLSVKGLWVETILYEIPLLALTSEAYFRFVDTNWTYDGQEKRAFDKAQQLLEAGCVFNEFGTRRRRDYHTQALVLRGLLKAHTQCDRSKFTGRLLGTSNVHLAMRFGLTPVGTVAHEWFMGVAAITDDYVNANYKAMSYWADCFGMNELGYVLTDTFGTPAFLQAFSQPIPGLEVPKTFAESSSGVRQDSGDPVTFVKIMKEFYERHNFSKKTIVFSDALNAEFCLAYKSVAEKAGFDCIFGIGTFFTNDFIDTKTGGKSAPLNIVMKLDTAAGRSAIKLSDNSAKNMGDPVVVNRVKKLLGYTETDWKLSDENQRWNH
ncbi:Nicotinate phosphoribosyltransferase [Golovinomyces cichoracearum]|uniref:Nicotinate phosphoribosyltransferase n=1 Tax=Golovinomyces cichoracearum TaxID=62708 RepID=A0A420ICF2_9PEZI|nr:Nicotinate phosphoribosyltransferase [Golovinomyces cichoracearum]